MPVRKVRGGYRWGSAGKVYPTRAQAEAQARAIFATGWRDDAAKAAKHLSASKRAESRYVLDLQQIMGAVHRAVLHVVHREMTASAARFRQAGGDASDVDPGELARQDAAIANVRMRLRALWDRLAAWVRMHVGDAFDRMAREVEVSSGKGARELLGIPVRHVPGMAGIIDEARAKNVKLITNASAAFLEQVRKTLEQYEGTHAGRGRAELGPNGEPQEEREPRDLAEALQQRVGVSRSRAVLIARDQTLKLNGQVNAMRQQSAGVKRFKWVTSHDERVRPSHRELDGKVFSWDDDARAEEMADLDVSEDDPSDEAPIPGGPINCRCTPSPVIEELEVPQEPTEIEEREPEHEAAE